VGYFGSFQKTKASHPPMGEDSPNLVTLVVDPSWKQLRPKWRHCEKDGNCEAVTARGRRIDFEAGQQGDQMRFRKKSPKVQPNPFWAKLMYILTTVKIVQKCGLLL
jgi:hypothetical protein